MFSFSVSPPASENPHFLFGVWIQPWQSWLIVALQISESFPAFVGRKVYLVTDCCWCIVKHLDAHWIYLVSHFLLTVVKSFSELNLTSVKSSLKKRCLCCHAAVFGGFCSITAENIHSDTHTALRTEDKATVVVGQELRKDGFCLPRVNVLTSPDLFTTASDFSLHRQKHTSCVCPLCLIRQDDGLCRGSSFVPDWRLTARHFSAPVLRWTPTLPTWSPLLFQAAVK